MRVERLTEAQKYSRALSEASGKRDEMNKTDGAVSCKWYGGCGRA